MKAFPYVREIDSPKEGYTAYVHEDGMDLRDYFAAAALISVAHLRDYKDKAHAAYQLADAMMKERAE